MMMLFALVLVDLRRCCKRRTGVVTLRDIEMVVTTRLKNTPSKLGKVATRPSIKHEDTLHVYLTHQFDAGEPGTEKSSLGFEHNQRDR
jgi:hypothetical protein